MKKILFVFIAMPMFLLSCSSQEKSEISEEEWQKFQQTFPDDTNYASKKLHINKLRNPDYMYLLDK